MEVKCQHLKHWPKICRFFRTARKTMYGKHAAVPHYRTVADLVKKFHEEGNVYALFWVLHVLTDSFLHGIFHFEMMCTNKKGMDLKNLQIFGQYFRCCHFTSTRVKPLILHETLCPTFKNICIKICNPSPLRTRVTVKARI